MLILKFLNLSVKNLYLTLSREQRKCLMCEYWEIDKIPKEMRDYIADIYLKENSHLRKLFNRCDITDTDIMIDCILRNLYLAVNYVPEDDWENDVLI